VERSKKKYKREGFAAATPPPTVAGHRAATPTSTYLAVEEEGNGKREERA